MAGPCWAPHTTTLCLRLLKSMRPFFAALRCACLLLFAFFHTTPGPQSFPISFLALPSPFVDIANCNHHHHHHRWVGLVHYESITSTSDTRGKRINIIKWKPFAVLRCCGGRSASPKEEKQDTQLHPPRDIEATPVAKTMHHAPFVLSSPLRPSRFVLGRCPKAFSACAFLKLPERVEVASTSAKCQWLLLLLL